MARTELHDGRERHAWLGLTLVPGLTVLRARRAVEQLGGAHAVLTASPARLAATGLPPAVAAAVPEGRRRVDAEAAGIAAAGARWVAWCDDDYPERLRAIADPPLGLVVRGTLVRDALAVAIVGSRRATAYGRRMAEELAGGLASAGVEVVSGLATGIDGTAHAAALAAGGRTIAVLGTGIDRVYPAHHAPLAAAVARQGALVSEFACGTVAEPFNFPRRNRIISGLCAATIVVEAARRSGSLVTARYALEQGREVLAVPGPVGIAGHVGPHRLIRDGATLITSADEVLEAIAPALRATLAAVRAAREAASLSPAERRVLEALGTDGGRVDDVVRDARLAPATALETLLALELRGLVEQHAGQRFRRKAA